MKQSEQDVIDYFDEEAEVETESAQEFTDLAKDLRRHQSTVLALAAERDALAARLAEAERQLADGSFYQEKDIDALTTRAESAERQRDYVAARLIEAEEKIAAAVRYNHIKDTPNDQA